MKKKIKAFFIFLFIASMAVFVYFFIQIYRGEMFARDEYSSTYYTTDFGGYKWIILDERDGLTLLLMETIWDFYPYHNEREAITWEHSSLRQILNDEFYNSLPQPDREKVVNMLVLNQNNRWYSTRTGGGNDTEDYVFLLSSEELVTYFGDSGQLWERPRPSGDAGPARTYISDFYNSFRVAYDSAENTSAWWLRSPGGTSENAMNVTISGLINMYGVRVDASDNGVRPALWVNQPLEFFRLEKHEFIH